MPDNSVRASIRSSRTSDESKPIGLSSPAPNPITIISNSSESLSKPVCKITFISTHGHPKSAYRTCAAANFGSGRGQVRISCSNLESIPIRNCSSECLNVSVSDIASLSTHRGLKSAQKRSPHVQPQTKIRQKSCSSAHFDAYRTTDAHCTMTLILYEQLSIYTKRDKQKKVLSNINGYLNTYRQTTKHIYTSTLPHHYRLRVSHICQRHIRNILLIPLPRTPTIPNPLHHRAEQAPALLS